jgi:hypothetical protein
MQYLEGETAVQFPASGWPESSAFPSLLRRSLVLDNEWNEAVTDSTAHTRTVTTEVDDRTTTTDAV